MVPPLSNDLTTQHGGETTARGGHTPWSSSSTTRMYSTYWVPLEEAIQYWLDVGREATLATALAAAGSALFALSHEKRALRSYTQGWHDSWRKAPPKQAQEACRQTGEHLSAAAQHWRLVVTLLDTLCGEQQQAVPADELGCIRALAQAAREQQARLDWLAEEIRADLAAAGGISAPWSPRPQQQEEMPWPSA
jgi:hypothetical protein